MGSASASPVGVPSAALQLWIACACCCPCNAHMPGCPCPWHQPLGMRRRCECCCHDAHAACSAWVQPPEQQRKARQRQGPAIGTQGAETVSRAAVSGKGNRIGAGGSCALMLSIERALMSSPLRSAGARRALHAQQRAWGQQHGWLGPQDGRRLRRASLACCRCCRRACQIILQSEKKVTPGVGFSHNLRCCSGTRC